MKRFMYASIGLLCLSLSALIGFHIGSRSASATVTTEPVGNIVAMYESTVLTLDGRIWTFDAYGTRQWIEHDYSPIPVPISDIQFIDNGNVIQFVDKNGDVWNRNGHYPQWTNVGHPPLPPVPTSGESWGSIKDKLKKGD